MPRLDGSSATTGNSTFHTSIFYSVTYAATTWTITYYYGIRVSKGDFWSSFIQGSAAKYTMPGASEANDSWSPTGYTLDGNGMYCVSSKKTRTLNYGQTLKLRAYAWYTGNSGTTYRSNITVTFKGNAAAAGLAPYVYSGGWKAATPYVYSGGWKAATPYVYSGGWKIGLQAGTSASVTVNKTNTY